MFSCQPNAAGFLFPTADQELAFWGDDHRDTITEDTMSMTKELAIELEQRTDDADLDVYVALSALNRLSGVCWKDEMAVAAPDQDWIDVTRQQLFDCLKMLGEVQAARDCL